MNRFFILIPMWGQFIMMIKNQCISMIFNLPQFILQMYAKLYRCAVLSTVSHLTGIRIACGTAFCCPITSFSKISALPPF